MLHKFNTNFLILGSKTVGLIKTKQMHFLLLFQIKIPAGCINIFRYHACFPKIFLLSPVRDTRFLSIVQFLSKKNRLLTDQDLPLKYLFASNLYSSAFTSSSANSPFAFSSAIFALLVSSRLSPTTNKHLDRPVI